jgi:hypothetical protein
MGHFYTTITGTGKNRQEAQMAAIDDFLWEEGNRHSVREVLHPKLLKKVPPKKWVKERNGRYTVQREVEDNAAPASDWLEVWEFELHTHA